MTATALWFGPPDRPLFGWWHVPEGGRARGGVVLCPPFGMEAASAGPSLRRLAARLSEAGFLVLRFDYDGTGDSAGQADDPGRVSSWLNSIQAAVDAVLAGGVARVAVVGMRMGATLAAVGAARGTKVDALVLWDPCPTGRSFLRHQRLMRELMAIGRVADDGSTEGPGIVFDADTTQELSALAIKDTDGALAPDVLVLTRSDRPADRAMVARLSMPNVRWGEVSGQADLVDVAPIFARTPEPDLTAIVSWLTDLWPTEDTPVNDPLVAWAKDSVVVARDEDGRAVWERPVHLGPHNLFGIVTEAEGGGNGTTVVLLPAGVLDHTGPARLWVNLARTWAQAGLRVVRFDTGGVGDSSARGSQSTLFASAPESIDDVADAIRQLTLPDERGLVLLGLCSGGYHSAEAALNFPLLGVYMVNPSFVPRREALAVPEPESGRRQAPPSTRRWARALPAHDLLSALIYRLPSFVWWVLNRTAVSQAPSSTLRRMAERGTELVVVCNTPDAWLATRGNRRAIRRLGRSGRMQVEIDDDIEHTLLARDGRERVVAFLTGHIQSRFGTKV